MVEFVESSNGEENVKIDTCERGSEVGKSVCGVTKSRNKWRARIQHPKLKIEISLGSYYNHEEAVLAVRKKKAEFLEMFKDDCSTKVKTSRDNFEGRQLPPGVRRRGYRRWAAMIYDPKLKRETSLGCYDTPEEAATVLDNKRDEFLKLYGWRPYVKRGRKTDDKLLEGPNWEVVTTREVLEEPNREVVTTSEFSTCGLMVPAGVKKLKSGEWCETRKWLDTFDNAEEDVGSLNKGKAKLAEERAKADKAPLNSCPASDLGSDNLNINSMSDKSNVADFSNKLEYTFVHSSHVSVIKTESSDSAHVNERSMMSIGNEQKKYGCVSEFDEPMSLSFINEYGQLVGKYSELDEQMDFS